MKPAEMVCTDGMVYTTVRVTSAPPSPRPSLRSRGSGCSDCFSKKLACQGSTRQYKGLHVSYPPFYHASLCATAPGKGQSPIHTNIQAERRLGHCRGRVHDGHAAQRASKQVCATVCSLGVAGSGGRGGGGSGPCSLSGTVAGAPPATPHTGVGAGLGAAAPGCMLTVLSGPSWGGETCSADEAAGGRQPGCLAVSGLAAGWPARRRRGVMRPVVCRAAPQQASGATHAMWWCSRGGVAVATVLHQQRLLGCWLVRCSLIGWGGLGVREGRDTHRGASWPPCRWP